MSKDDEKKQLILAYKFFDTEDGKLVLADLSKNADMDYSLTQPTGTDGHTDVFRVMHREGKRCMVARIVRKKDQDPDFKRSIS